MVNKKFIDFYNRRIFLINERWKHIIEEHQEVIPYSIRIEDVLSNPDIIKESVYNNNVLLFYKFYNDIFRGKYLVVVVKYNINNIILTCYITDRIKGGKIRWERD